MFHRRPCYDELGWVPVQELPGTPSLTLGRGVGEGEQGLLGSGLGAGAGRQVGV